jgi:Asp-tRNA(Asn)/Glu-tRNA(Gln) amidotransferase A subunit family amidase
LPWTFAGLPTLTLPSGLSEKGLPLGMQLAGSFYQDEKLISDAVSFSRQPQEN